MYKKSLKTTLYILSAAVIIIGYGYINDYINRPALPDSFAFGNGRIEASEIGIAAKIPGRLEKLHVNEGDIVEKGQILARLDTDELEAKLRLAEAQIKQAIESKNHATAVLEQKKSESELSAKNYERAKNLYEKSAVSLLEFQRQESAYISAKAAVKAAEADIEQMRASVSSAKAQADSIKVNIDDSTLYAPAKGRILYKIAQEGEVIGAGKEVLVLLDLLNVYMTIFLPASQTGALSYDSEARVVLDAFPAVAIPAKVTFVSPKAQFTPKQIETKEEREKLMFRVKVSIDKELLEKHIQKVKTGLPGVAYIRLDEDAVWPQALSNLPKSYVKRPN